MQESVRKFYSALFDLSKERELMLLGNVVVRKMIKSFNEFVKYYGLLYDLFIGLFDLAQQQRKVYDKIFLDIDADDILQAYASMRRVSVALSDEGIGHVITFSGSKGFHVYIPIKNVELNSYSMSVRRWLSAFSFSNIDYQCIEPRRLCRVVGSINSKSGLYCVVVNPASSISEILYNASVGISSDFNITKNDLSFLKAYDDDGDRQSNASGSKLVLEYKSYPACMKKLYVKALLGQRLEHSERLELGIFLLKQIDDVDEVVKFYSLQDDYKHHITKYQLDYAKERKLKNSGCMKLSEDGLCPLSDMTKCPFYPSLNSYVDW